VSYEYGELGVTNGLCKKNTVLNLITVVIYLAEMELFPSEKQVRVLEEVLDDGRVQVLDERRREELDDRVVGRQEALYSDRLDGRLQQRQFD
jgi:hypothetical protein